MEKKETLVLVLVALAAVALATAGLGYAMGAMGTPGARYSGMTGGSYGGMMGGSYGSGQGMMGHMTQSSNYGMHWNSTEMPDQCYQYMQRYWNSTSAP